MEKIMVSAATGAMKPLMGKLTTLMGEEFAKLTNLRKEVKFLSDELGSVKDALEMLAYVDVLDPQEKTWSNKLREICYDTEDIIDDFMQNIGEKDHNSWFGRNFIRHLTTLNFCHKLAGKTEEIKKLVYETSDRRKRYGNIVTPPNNIVDIDTRVGALYENAASLTGVQELVDSLKDEEKKLKAVSIVGCGGLGKTTLANVVYNQLKGEFHYCAFVTVSQNPYIPKLLLSLLSQLGITPSNNYCGLNILLDQLREHLQNERYLILVDDIWDVQTWDIMRYAFPENDLGSRLIVTTRIQEVSTACCSSHRDYILQMKPLSHEESRKLFFGRIFGSEEACPHQLKDVSVEILKKCDGLPLAIISISSMLASESSIQKERWEHVRDSLSSETNPTLGRMRKILNLSYRDLPPHLRTCFLYLGMYPEDYMIERLDLEHQWIAEGFISKENGQEVEKVARSCFNQLVNRSLIKPIDFDNGGSVTSCKVHDMFRDLILIKAAEENFFTIVDNSEPVIRLDCKIRRLSVRMSVFSPMDFSRNISLPQVRSLMLFGHSWYGPPLSEFKFLRVFRTDSPNGTYVGLCKLQHLRYVRIDASHWYEQPVQISVQQQLETLHLGNHWLWSDKILGSYGISNVNTKSLRCLIGFDIARNTLDDINYLGEMANLRYLVLECSSGPEDREKRMAALRSSLGRLSNLENLVLTGSWSDIDGLLPLSPPRTPYRLQKLCMSRRARFSIVPSWMGGLRNLYELQCRVRELLNDGAGILGELPLLTRLDIEIEMGGYTCESSDHVNYDALAAASPFTSECCHGLPTSRTSVSGGGAFPALKCLDIEIGSGCPSNLTFQAGAMPKLQRLSLKFNGSSWLEHSLPPAGIKHLLALEELSAEIVCEESHNTIIESAFRSVVAMNPSQPRFVIKFSRRYLDDTLSQLICLSRLCASKFLSNCTI